MRYVVSVAAIVAAMGLGACTQSSSSDPCAGCAPACLPSQTSGEALCMGTFAAPDGSAGVGCSSACQGHCGSASGAVTMCGAAGVMACSDGRAATCTAR